MTDFEYEVPMPGQFIQEELNARGWAQRDLAFILGIEETALNKIIKGKTGISLDMSKALAAAFNVDPDFFANLQKAYDLAHTPASDPAIARRATLQGRYPVREMIKRGWLKNLEPALLEIQLNRFFKADNDNDVMQIRHIARKTNAGEDATLTQQAWLHRVVQIAESIECKPYSERALYQAQTRLKALMIRPEDIQQVAGILAECGLRFLVVEGLPAGKIDGVCIWLNPNKPVVALSLRFDRIDNFWFVLWHEVTHVLNRDGKSESAWIIDVELEKDRVKESVQERKANEGAAEKCVPEGDMISFLARRDRFIAEQEVLFFARQMKVHPGVVVGQIHNRTKKYELLRKHQVKIRQYLMPTAMVDGWGQVAPVSI
jgi:HTH-type transcriptional regulator/antitoxin HigA